MRNLFLLLLILTGFSCCCGPGDSSDYKRAPVSRDTCYCGVKYRYIVCSPGDIRMAWKDSKGTILRSVEPLRAMVEAGGNSLLFAMNGGMFVSDGAPCGLYVEAGKPLQALARSSGGGNFHMPFCNTPTNGVFLTTNQGTARIVRSID